MTSMRLPGKVLLPLAGKPALERLIERLKRSKYVDAIVVATTTNAADDPIVSLAKELHIGYHRGSEADVLKRVLDAARSVSADVIVEITGDCPLMDWRLVDRGIEEFFSHNVDYASNCITPSYPAGFEVQIFPVEILADAAERTEDPIDRLHVSYYIYQHPELYRLYQWKPDPESARPDMRLTLDERDDYIVLSTIFENLVKHDNDFSVQEVIRYLVRNPHLLAINSHVKQKEPSQG